MHVDWFDPMLQMTPGPHPSPLCFLFSLKWWMGWPGLIPRCSLVWGWRRRQQEFSCWPGVKRQWSTYSTCTEITMYTGNTGNKKPADISIFFSYFTPLVTFPPWCVCPLQGHHSRCSCAFWRSDWHSHHRERGHRPSATLQGFSSLTVIWHKVKWHKINTEFDNLASIDALIKTIDHFTMAELFIY